MGGVKAKLIDDPEDGWSRLVSEDPTAQSPMGAVVSAGGSRIGVGTGNLNQHALREDNRFNVRTRDNTGREMIVFDNAYPGENGSTNMGAYARKDGGLHMNLGETD